MNSGSGNGREGVIPKAREDEGAKGSRRTGRLLAFIVLAIAAGVQGAPGMAAIPLDEMDTSVEGVCRAYPERVAKVFESLDLDRPGLEPVKSAADSGDWPKACRALLGYYRTSDTAAWLRKPSGPPGDGSVPEAEQILDDTFTFYTVTAKAPRLADGRLDWQFRGPTNDHEWAMALNRHYHLRTLARAYDQTRNPAYVRCFDRHVRDWITSNPYINRKGNDTVNWRGLEAFFRVKAWGQGFFGFQHLAELTPAAKIMMLSSIPEHAHYLRTFHAPSSNWITMEMNGLARAAVCWPEFKESPEWLGYAIKRMTEQIEKGQVYPDGAQHELTSSYHRTALRNFEEFAEVVSRAGRKLPAPYEVGLERMWNYLAYTMRPDGYGLMNNDSDHDHTQPLVLQSAKQRNRPDWTYIATNGREGTKPKGEPSVVFPWAGHVVMRSGWGADAHWAFFDVGPLGGHVHYDKLHLSIAAFGHDILVDGGRYSYAPGAWQAHFRSSASHNVILIDGKGQRRYQPLAKEPMKGNYMVRPDCDFARGTFDGGYHDVEGKVTHTRSVLYVRGEYWVVVDRIDTDRPREVTALWHFHPECAVSGDGRVVSAAVGNKGRLSLVPATDIDWTLDIVKGRTKPIQGWWSRHYNHKEPSPCAVFSTRLEESASFVWVLIPDGDREAGFTTLSTLEDRWEICRVQSTGDTVVARFSGGGPARFPGGSVLDSDCVVHRKEGNWLVIGGRVLDADGNVVARDILHRP